MNELALHPYYKLVYFELAWGGAKEQEQEREAGNLDAKNWQDEANKVLETEVFNFLSRFLLANKFQIEKYWKNRPRPPARTTPAAGAVTSSAGVFLSEYD